MKKTKSVLRLAGVAAATCLALGGALAQTAPATVAQNTGSGAASAAPVVRGDRNTSITTRVQRNVPAGQRTPQTSRYRPADPVGAGDPPDVLLDVPHLSVDELTLEVENLQAQLQLDARVANLVKITAGVNAGVEQVKLTIKGVQASALLVVRLDNVRAIIERTLTTLENNPQLVEQLLQTVDNTVNTVGDVANTAVQPGGVLSQTVNTLGQTVTRTVDRTGNIVERTVDQAGRVVGSNTVGRALDLPVLHQGTNAAGQTVRQVRDASGSVLELTLDRAGQLLGSRVLRSGSSGTGAGGAGTGSSGLPPMPR